jgi:hypothetical protein
MTQAIFDYFPGYIYTYTQVYAWGSRKIPCSSLKQPYSFPVALQSVPGPSLNWRFISIDPTVLASFFADVRSPQFSEQYYSTVFQILYFIALRIYD